MGVRLHGLEAQPLVAAVPPLHLAQVERHVLKHQAEVVAVLKVVVEAHAVVSAALVQLLQLLQNLQLPQARLVPFWVVAGKAKKKRRARVMSKRGGGGGRKGGNMEHGSTSDLHELIVAEDLNGHLAVALLNVARTHHIGKHALARKAENLVAAFENLTHLHTCKWSVRRGDG